MLYTFAVCCARAACGHAAAAPARNVMNSRRFMDLPLRCPCEDREKIGLMSGVPADSTIVARLSSNASSARLLFKGNYGNDTSFSPTREVEYDPPP
jgi:hypothetical protein